MVTGNQAQRKSELVKDGPGDAHEKAKERLCLILINQGYEIFPDAIFQVRFSLASQNEFSLYHHDYYHEFDIFARKKIPMGMKDRLIPIKGKYDLTAELICWIDGEIHEHQVQKCKDKTAEGYATFHLKDVRQVRIPIDVLIGPKKWDDSVIIQVYKLR